MAGRPTAARTLSLYCIDINTDYVRRDRVRAGHLGRRQRPQRGLRGAVPQRVLPEHQRTGRPDRSQPEGRRRPGGDLVLQRPLRAEHRPTRCTTPWRRSWPRSRPGAAASSRHRPASPSPRRSERPRRRARSDRSRSPPTPRDHATVTATGGTCSRTRQARSRSPTEPGAVRPEDLGAVRPVRPPRCSRPPRRQPSPPATSTSTTATPAGSATPST